jgi:transposase
MLSKFLLRKGWRFDERGADGRPVGTWTQRHWEWIKGIRFEEADDREVLHYYVARAEYAIERKRKLEEAVKEAAGKPRWKPVVDALRTMKGVETVTAFAVACEAGSFSRFKKATSFAAWIGLTPSESSSGQKVSRGGITKAGNKHLRKLLVESAWHYGTSLPHAKALRKDQRVSPEVRAHATKGIKRLTEKRKGYVERGVRPCVANVAVARELACWLWALGSMAEAEAGAAE